VEFNLKSRERLWLVLAAGIVGLILIVVAGYYVWTSFVGDEVKPKVVKKAELPRMANLPPKKKTIPPPPPPSYTPDAPALERARKALREGISPEDAVVLANSLPESPERADAAFLLLEYAADSGLAPAALAVARYYDPSDEAPSGTIRKNPASAFDWYTEALAGGQEGARPRLDQLRRWAEEQAAQGSIEARDLLKTWP